MKEQVLSKIQMRELKDLGIDISKASMCYCDLESDEYHFGKNVIVPNNDNLSQYGLYKENLSPTFTLQDILKMFKPLNGQWNLMDYGNGFEFNYFGKNICFSNPNILEAAFNMLKWCKENKYI